MAKGQRRLRFKPKAQPTRRTCKAESRAGKCLLYNKTHTEQRAATGHIRNIKKRGGTVQVTKKGGKIILDYSFKKR